MTRTSINPRCPRCKVRHDPPMHKRDDADLYVCPTTGETESRTMGGFDVCCDHPGCPGNTRVIPPGEDRRG